MTQVFILQNQDKLFLNKKNEWSDGRDLASLYRTAHKDEAVNQLFETSSKDYSQRIQLVSCPVNDKGLPEIDPAIMPPPLPKPDASADNAETELQAAATADDAADSAKGAGENPDLIDELAVRHA